MIATLLSFGVILLVTMYLTWVLFVAIMCLRVVRDAGRLTKPMMPFGYTTLAIGLMFDAALNLSREGGSDDIENESEPSALAVWAYDQLDRNARLTGSLNDESSVKDLLTAGLAEAAVHLELCKTHLTSGLEKYCKSSGGGMLAESLGMEWP